MRKIHKKQFSYILPIFIFLYVLASHSVPSIAAASSSRSEDLFVSTVSGKFYEIANNLANSDDTTYFDNELAISFLIGAMNLDGDNSEINSLLLKCICRYPEQHSLSNNTQSRTYIDLVYTLLQKYVDNNADMDLVSKATAFLLNQTGSAIQKETLLVQMQKQFANKNSVFNSDLLVDLGMLKLQNGLPADAEKYFKQAYQINKYNKAAFSKLYESFPKDVSPAEYLERLRLDFRENPTDLKVVLAFCRSLEQFQLYDTAAEAYEFSSQLFTYLYPAEALPADIYIPWSINCYNSKNYQSKCQFIADSIRNTDKFDIRLESLAGRAASKLGQDTVALQIIRNAEQKALDLLNKKSPEITEAQLAWFYSFVLPMPDKAMEWANKAFAANSNSPAEASLLIYALTQKREFTTAKSLINQFPSNQITELALGQIQLAEGQKRDGIENLNKAISRDPGSFEAEHAKDILAKNGEKYNPPINPDSLLASLNNMFGNQIVPDFIPPEKMFFIAFNIRNRELPFGNDLDCAIAVKNDSPEPIVLSDDSVLKGNIRIDAVVNGDMSKDIPNLISRRIGNDEVLLPGKSKIVNLKLITGDLREMLLTYPQASLNINFTLYIDPVNTKEGKVSNRIAQLRPFSVTVKRPGVVTTTQGIKNLVDSISTGQIGQKIQSSQLFISLLKEQHAFSGRTPPYHMIYSDGITNLLKSALVSDSGLLKNQQNGGWVVKVFTMAELSSLKLDFELLQAASDNLYDPNWPVRMMAVYLLAESQGKNFVNVLESISNNDHNQLVMDIAAEEMQKINSMQD